MNTTQQINLVIVDDHPVMRRGLAVILEQNKNFRVVGQADGESDAQEVLTRTSPDCIIVDISLKDGNGLELVKKVRTHFPQIYILVVSMYEESLYAERALRAGAKGYVTKQEAADRIVDALHIVLQGGIYVSEPLARKIMGRVFSNDSSPQETGVRSLTDRELQIFELLGHGKDIHEIAEILQLSSRTVETHRYNIVNKLNLKKSSELIRETIYWIQVENRKVPSERF